LAIYWVFPGKGLLLKRVDRERVMRELGITEGDILDADFEEVIDPGG